MNLRHPLTLGTLVAVVAGVALTVALVLYALRSSIDLFYTPTEVLHGKRETQRIPEVGQRLRMGGMILHGSVQRVAGTLQVHFAVYDARAVVNVRYDGVLPDQFREGQSVVVQGNLQPDNQIQATEVLTKHDENYTPPEVEQAMQDNHRLQTQALAR